MVFPDYARRLIDLDADIVINNANRISDGYQRDVRSWNLERTQGLVSTFADGVLAMPLHGGWNLERPQGLVSTRALENLVFSVRFRQRDGIFTVRRQ